MLTWIKTFPIFTLDKSSSYYKHTFIHGNFFCKHLWFLFLLMPCGHLLGKGWPLGSHLWCLIVKMAFSHWYPGSGVVLDCIDSWSLPSYLLLLLSRHCKKENGTAEKCGWTTVIRLIVSNIWRCELWSCCNTWKYHESQIMRFVNKRVIIESKLRY